MKGLSRDSRALIDAARDGDEPSGADRRRVRAALARKLAVGAAAGAVAVATTNTAAGGFAAAGTSGGAAAVTSAGAGVTVGAASGTAATVGTLGTVATGATAVGFGAKLLVSVALVGALGAGGVEYVHHETTRRAEVAARAVAVRVDPPRVERPAAAPPPVIAAPAREREAPAPEPLAAAPAPLAAAPRPAAAIARASEPRESVAPVPGAASEPSSLDREVALLQEAHVALQANDGARALRLLDERARTFPGGALGEEAAAARVFALVQVGRAEEARDVAARFLREHPRSPLAPRVSRAVESGTTTF